MCLVVQERKREVFADIFTGVLEGKRLQFRNNDILFIHISGLKTAALTPIGVVSYSRCALATGHYLPKNQVLEGRRILIGLF